MDFSVLNARTLQHVLDKNIKASSRETKLDVDLHLVLSHVLYLQSKITT